MKWVDKGNELTYKARNVIEQFDERKKSMYLEREN